MSCDLQPDISALPSGTPGAAGATGGTGSTGATGAAGGNAYTTLTESFTQPAVGGAVEVTVGSTAWMAIGLTVYIADGGYYTVASVGGATTATLTNSGVSTNADPDEIVPDSGLVVPAGPVASYAAEIAALGDRVTTIEGTAIFTDEEGAHTFYSATEPSGLGEKEGDIWFDTDDGNRIYRYNGSEWVDVKAAIEASEIVGEITETQIADDSISTPKLQANSITAAKLATNELITQSAQIKNGIIQDAHIGNLSAGKIIAGDIGAINIGAAGKLYNPSYPGVYFKAITLGTALDTTYTTGTGTSFGFTKPTPVEFVGPGHADAGTKLIVNPDEDGYVHFRFDAAILGDSPDVNYITIFWRKNDTGPYFAAMAKSSAEAGGQTAHGRRGGSYFGTFNATDSIKFYCAPCDGSGNIATSVTCRVELDVEAYNWM